jgi:PAS domain S-box-containing protein
LWDSICEEQIKNKGFSYLVKDSTMANKSASKAEEQLRTENEELQQRLAEAEETLYAIRNGEVDAIVVSGAEGARIFSLTSAETPYRIMMEEMHEGAATLMADTTIIHCNSRFAELVARPAEQTVGASFSQFISDNEKPAFTRLFNSGLAGKSSGDITFLGPENEVRYYHLSFSPLPHDVTGDVCMIVSDFTERKQAEELRISEEKYKSIFELSVIGKLMTSISDGKMKVNKAFCEMLGYSETELSAMNWQSITHPEDLKHDQKTFSSLISGEKETARWEKRYIHKNGKIVWVDISTTIQRDKDNNPLFFNTSIIDISERKQALKELQQSEERYRSLLTNLETGIVVHAPDTSIIMYNLRASELLGLSEDQMKGRLAVNPDWKFIHPDGVSMQIDEYPVNRVISSGKAFSNMVLGVIQPAGKTLVWLTVNGFPAYDDRGEISEVIISFIDISERKQAEDDLTESNNKFRAIFENNSASMAIILPDTTILMVNDEYCKMSGYTRDEVIGTSWTRQIPPEDLERLKEYNRRRLIDPQDAPDKYEFTFYNKNGEIVHSLMSISIFNRMIIASFVDITELKQAEADLLKKMDELLQFQRLTVGRELKMIELKKEINELLKGSGKEEKYRIVE